MGLRAWYFLRSPGHTVRQRPGQVHSSEINDGQEFVFYGPHNWTLKDPGLLRILYGEVHPLETVKDGNVQDYSLSKFQGAKHGSNQESYDNLAFAGVTEDELLGMKWKPDQIAAMKKLRALDIVTIRNRRFSTDPMLSWVGKELKKHGWTYKTFHGSF